MRLVQVVKMSGTGNDFLMVDNWDGKFSEADLPKLTKHASARRVSAGADGAIFLEKAKAPGHDYKMRIVNADGSEAEMCGNGSRCIAVFANQLGRAGLKQVIETLAGTLHAEVAEDGRSAKVQLSQPNSMELKEGVDVLGEKADLYFINTGVPHAVQFVKDVAAVDVKQRGAALRYHEVFKPKGTNANFVQLLGGNAIKLRTYERGVEDETLACGTGATAAAICTALAHGYSAPVKVHVASGDVLTIHFSPEKAKKTSSRPFLEGAVRTVYKGEYYWE
ncbi:MAG: diaminopimelate epimerase [Planctomycetes bacterium]|nr:diaminopimelate epimerase [Planctomycetota bacterium]